MAENLAVLRAAVDAWNAHDRDRYVTGYLPNVKLHGFPEGVDDAATLGDFFAGFWEAVPDARLALGDAFEAGDQAAARLTITGTHEGELMGVPATHRPISVEVIPLLRFGGDGRIAERWNVADFLSMLQQIGAIPAPA
jgi:predicted ester cyclase